MTHFTTVTMGKAIIGRLLDSLPWARKESSQQHSSGDSTPPNIQIPISREMLKTCERLGPNPSMSPVYRVDKKTVVKCSDGVRTAEADAMRLVREKTSIPVPEVYDAYIVPNSNYGCIVMEYIEGEQLDKVWNSYSSSQKQGIIVQLRRYMDELRDISGTFIGSVDGTYCMDQFFGENTSSYGPFESQADFHDGLARAVGRRGCHDYWPVMVVRFIKALPQHHKIVLTHGDLAPRNILVNDSKIVAIIDWEFSGFYPEYWEYVKSHFFPDWESPWMADQVFNKILDPFFLELSYLMHARDIIW